MPPVFDAVPFDIWHQIAGYLDPNDYVNLSLANRTLYRLLKDEITARKAVKAHIAYTVEGELAAAKKISNREALGRVYDIREAIASAQPYSASLLALGNEFLFNQGVVCYISDGRIRTLNVLKAAEYEEVVDLKEILDSYPLISNGRPYSKLRYKLLCYCDGMVALVCQPGGRDSSWLLAIDMNLDYSTARKPYRVRFCRPLTSTRNLFVRLNRSFMYFGTHSGRGRHGHREWVLEGFSFVEGSDTSLEPIQLENFVGSEIGSTVCFEVKDGYFYAISNQTSFEDEEIDWTSYYICVRFPLSNPVEVKWQRIWRRQHREGPINDNWTKLSLVVDPTTRQLTIVECRHEWENSGSENFRIHYSQPLDCFDLVDGTHGTEFSLPKSGLPKYLPVRSLPDDQLAKTLDPSSRPNYEPPKKRHKRFYHLEYTPEEAQSPSRRDFTLSNTKFHGYNLMASAFIDLVNDPPQPVKSFTTPPDRLRLRIGARKRQFQQYEMDDKGSCATMYPRSVIDISGYSTSKNEEGYQSCGIKMWPPNDAPLELLKLLSPTPKSGKVVAAADERFMVYSTDAGMNDGTKALVLISFDPSFGLKHMKPLRRKTPEFHPKVLRSKKAQPDAKISTAQKMFATHPEPTWFKMEPAEYLKFNYGFWLR
ncbi:F-box domain-containing protein [Nannizzia gypsea CBS 118893]|uniref:F-box domain-containing protein n=1 Tax=Arthroderma gypseum (strain ATCC MYA-4604 / CBS 118893) TaxID=535722 RepID=E5R1B5_ARTGP|nr:F-box domain-containing protein [Nannizzia gypsea CBS 118893]EFQ97666.1 F-box domain-containing protein [Nannizzia gypsea CBS 118893]